MPTTPSGIPEQPARTLFSTLSPGSARNLADTLRDERTGGLLLLAGAIVALLWANLAPGSYQAVSGTVLGPAALHLDLTVAHWAADGLLAVFFFVVGLELKRELVVGEVLEQERGAQLVDVARQPPARGGGRGGGVGRRGRVLGGRGRGGVLGAGHGVASGFGSGPASSGRRRGAEGQSCSR